MSFASGKGKENAGGEPNQLTNSDMIETTIIPTVQLIVELLASEKLCPPRITVSAMNPMNCKQFKKPQISAGQYPSAYRACTICRMPVRGPFVAQ